MPWTPGEAYWIQRKIESRSILSILNLNENHLEMEFFVCLFFFIGVCYFSSDFQEYVIPKNIKIVT